jgi:Tfp pilus assembly protein FimT
MQRRERGVSLAEFTVTLFITASATLAVAPVYFSVAKDYRLSRETNELVAALMYARTQSVMQQRPVRVCSSNNGRYCTETPWTDGYIVWLDEMPGTDNGGGRALKRQHKRSSDISISLKGKPYVRFGPLGDRVPVAIVEEDRYGAKPRAGWLTRLEFVAPAHATANPIFDDDAMDPAAIDTFVICAGKRGRMIKVSFVGRITTARISCNAPLAAKPFSPTYPR